MVCIVITLFVLPNYTEEGSCECLKTGDALSYPGSSGDSSARADIGTNQNYFTPITAATTSPGLFTILVLLLLFVGLSRMSRPILVHICLPDLNKVYQI